MWRDPSESSALAPEHRELPGGRAHGCSPGARALATRGGGERVCLQYTPRARPGRHSRDPVHGSPGAPGHSRDRSDLSASLRQPRGPAVRPGSKARAASWRAEPGTVGPVGPVGPEAPCRAVSRGDCSSPGCAGGGGMGALTRSYRTGHLCLARPAKGVRTWVSE